MSAELVNLTADAGKSGAADAVLTVKIVNGQSAVPCLVIELLNPFAGNAPDRIFPVVLIVMVYMVKLLLELMSLAAYWILSTADCA